MAAGTLFTVLSNIPWGQVVDNAPKVADAASKLWNTVSNRRRQAEPETQPDSAPAELDQAERMQARVLALEESTRVLQEELQSSSALIKALAEQNTLLVERVELNRRRMRRFAVTVAVGGMALLTALVVLVVLFVQRGLQ